MIGQANEGWKGVDKVVVICILILASAGLMAIYSATASADVELSRDYFSRQVIWLLFGIMLASAVVLMPVKFLNRSAYWFYALSLALLILVLFIGSGKGVQRWFGFGIINIQPSEIAKIAALVALARYLSDESCDLRRPRDIAIAFAIVIIPSLLILKQPDLGSAFSLLAIILPVLFWAGLSSFLIFIMVSPLIVIISAFNVFTFAFAMVIIVGLLLLTKRKLPILILVFVLNVTAGAITPQIWDRLHDYQKTRILTFLGLEEDPRGTGYQVAQSQVAIGSGGLWGKGWSKGTQTKLQFLPERHTDFIFSVIGEEFGFWGVLILLSAFLVLLLRSIQIASEINNRFLRLVVVGSVTILAVRIVVNVGMTVGMMPVTGLPLPFLSYGGSALWTDMILIGFILSGGVRKFQY